MPSTVSSAASVRVMNAIVGTYGGNFERVCVYTVDSKAEAESLLGFAIGADEQSVTYQTLEEAKTDMVPSYDFWTQYSGKYELRSRRSARS